MNYVIFGYGSIGKEYLKIIKKNKYQFIYVVDINFTKIKVFKNVIYLNFETFKINSYNVSHVFICTPSSDHFEIAKYFLNKKISVLIEKPFVLKYSQAKKLISYAKKNNTKCWVCFQNRFNKSIILAKKMLLKKDIGEIKFINSSLFWNRDFDYYNNGWRGKYASDGGVLTNQSIHLIDMIEYLFGKITKFNGVLFFDKLKLEAEDLISLNMMNDTNLPISFNATTRADKDHEMSIDIYGSKGMIKIAGIALNKIYVNNKLIKNSSENFKTGFGVHHQDVINSFINYNNDENFLNIKYNLNVIKLINSVYNKLINQKYYHKLLPSDSLLGKKNEN
mgnify:FL=1|tara:strand:+ start:18000 stop:19004 length:1005 start_codon:yes stop_codon:yes gene_type:complete